MKSQRHVFNFFLVLLTILTFSACSTSEERQRKQELSTIRVHVESDSTWSQSASIAVHRSSPVRLNIEREPILDEHNVVSATIVEQPGGFAVQVQFDRQGSWVLERTTVKHRGQRLAIFSSFGQEDRWLAAPLITGMNRTGGLTFTPDASREEAESFVRGLNNSAQKISRKANWPFREPLDK